MNPNLPDPELRTLFDEQRHDASQRARPFAQTWRAAESRLAQTKGGGWTGRAIAPGARFALFAAVLAIAFGRPLIDLARFAETADLFSYILLVPFVSGYLVWQQRGQLRAILCRPSALALIPTLFGTAVLGEYWLGLERGGPLPRQDQLCLVTLAFYALLMGGGLFFLGKPRMQAAAFPAAFLVFMVPLPTLAIDGLEVFFQYASAEAANLFLSISGTPFIRDGLLFKLPGLSILVAQECSGIRASLVLFITSLLAGHFFLRSPWKKLLLAACVIPLGILRNGFRILTITLLTVHVDPTLIDSPIHHQGGPIFFVLSLFPFGLLLWWLHKSERVPRSTNLPTVAK